MSGNGKRRTATVTPTPRPATGEASGIGLSTVNYRQQAAPPVPPGADLLPRRTNTDSALAGASFSESDESPSWDDLIPAPGERIGKDQQYEIIQELGRGGMGVVLVARDRELGRLVAIKFQYGEPHPGDAERFTREAQATASVGHDNIVTVYEVGKHRGAPYMVLEYLSGQSLKERLKNSGRLPPAEAVEIIVSVVSGVVAAHAVGVIHRDLKPDNIFIVATTGTVKVLDFGVAKLRHGKRELLLARGTGAKTAMTPDDVGDLEHERTRKNLTSWRGMLGTLRYMAPEQWRGTVEVDQQADVWAIGIILYRMLTGEHPLGALSSEEALESFMEQMDLPMPSIRDARPELPIELADVVDGCLLKHKEERIESAEVLLKALEPLRPGRERSLQPDESPYAGLASFQEDDASKFFGRNREIAAAVARLRDAPMVAVVGASGVGKSSFVRAGLIPTLRALGETWETLVVRPGPHPMAALVTMLAPFENDSENTAITVAADLSQQQSLGARLYEKPGLAGGVLRSHARRHGVRILVFVDQFEEVYTQTTDPAERAAFTACLAAIADDATSPLRVVLAIRGDFLDHVDPALLTELTRGLFFLGPPNREGLRDAIANPAEMAGFRFELSIIDDMLAHLKSAPGALPLLQFAASKLWEQRDTARRLLTMDRYREMGGVAGALASHADAVVAGCTLREQAITRALFLRLVTAERTRALVPVRELDDLSPDLTELQRVIDRLVDSRLLVIQNTTSERGGMLAGASIELVHESLMTSWPLLRRWLDETVEDSAFLEQLRQAAKQWLAKGYSQDLLWRGEAVNEARRWRSRFRGELPDLQLAFLDAAFALADRASRRARLAVIAAMVVLALLTSAATIAFFMIRDAEREATTQAHTATTERQKADAERANAVDANRKLESQNTALVKAIDAANRAKLDSERARGDAERARVQADEARLRAETAQRYERLSKRRATTAANDARAAEATAKRASAELAVRLVQERQRVKELEELTRGATIIPQVELRDGE